MYDDDGDPSSAGVGSFDEYSDVKDLEGFEDLVKTQEQLEQELTDKIVNDLRTEEFDDLAKNQVNILELDTIQEAAGELQNQAAFRLYHGISPPLLILLSGSPFAGTSTLAAFLRQHIVRVGGSKRGRGHFEVIQTV